jgi:membrane fusion protein (multidrug efflux system)
MRDFFRRGRVMTLVGAVSVIAAMLLPVACRGRQEGTAAAAGKPATKVRLAPAVRRTLESTVELAGTVRPDVTARVLAPVEGTVTNVSAREGDRVSAGQVIAAVSPLVRDDIVNAARLELEQRRRDAKDTLEARRQLDFALNTYHEAPVVAPIDGVVAQKFVDPGDMVTSRQKLYEIQSADNYYVEVPVSELSLPACRVGTVVRVMLDAAPVTPLTGTIRRVHPVVVEQTRTSIVEITLSSAPPGLSTGMFARVALPLQRAANAVVVPERALLTAVDGSVFVFVYADSVVSRRRVTTGIESPDGVEVLTGLAEGEMVVVAGHESLKDGQSVAVQEEKTKTPGAGKP